MSSRVSSDLAPGRVLPDLEPPASPGHLVSVSLDDPRSTLAPRNGPGAPWPFLCAPGLRRSGPRAAEPGQVEHADEPSPHDP